MYIYTINMEICKSTSKINNIIRNFKKQLTNHETSCSFPVAALLSLLSLLLYGIGDCVLLDCLCFLFINNVCLLFVNILSAASVLLPFICLRCCSLEPLLLFWRWVNVVCCILFCAVCLLFCCCCSLCYVIVFVFVICVTVVVALCFVFTCAFASICDFSVWARCYYGFCSFACVFVMF